MHRAWRYIGLAGGILALAALVERLTGGEEKAAGGSSARDEAVVSRAGSELTTRQRHPIAVCFASQDRFAYVANARSGSISVVDVAGRRVVAEHDVARGLSDFIATPDPEFFLATDDVAHQLLLLEIRTTSSTSDVPPRSELHVRRRLPVSPYPVSVVMTAGGRRAYVTSLWSRRLTEVVIERAGSEIEVRVARTLDLPFAPRKQLPVRDDSRLIVADSFRARLAVVDPKTLAVVSVREFPGHNIRGLAVNAERTMLIVSHQMLNELAHGVRNDVHWGLLMSNDLRWLRLDVVLDGQQNLYDGGHMHPLGEAGSATADPAGVVVAPDGTVVVALGGVGEVAVGRESDYQLRRTRVGERPTNLAVSQDSRTAVVVNTLSDSISWVDLVEKETLGNITLGPSPPDTLVDRGERLFYDARLSHDGWMSCHSCHSEGHTNGMLNDNFSDKSFGAPKRVLSLLGRADTAPFAWNGSHPTLADQIRSSIEKTMQSEDSARDEDVEALAAFVEQLRSPPSIDELRGTRDDDSVARGRRLFQTLECSGCHVAPTYTSPETYDVGLQDKVGNTRFNPPSLRGVFHRPPYFHDNRAATLESVFREHGHQLARDLPDDELHDLITFLRSL